MTKILSDIAHLLPLIGLIVLSVVLLMASALVFFALLRRRKLLHQHSVFIELTPPANNHKSASATEQLFSVLHGFNGGHSLIKQLIMPPQVLSLEIVSSKSQGIRFLVRVPKGESANFRAAVTAYLPEVKVGRSTDYIPAQARVFSFSQKAHFAYPLQTQTVLEKQDPLAYLTSAMTRLKAGELIAIQLVISPVRVAKVESLAFSVLHNEDLQSSLKRRPRIGLKSILNLINHLLFGVLGLVTELALGRSSNNYSYNSTMAQRQQSAIGLRPARQLSAFEQQLYEAVHHKLSQPQFRVEIRALMALETKEDFRRRLASLQSALASFSVPGYQALVPKRHRRTQKYILHSYSNRLPALRQSRSNLLAVSELAALYHFPLQVTTKTENIARSLSRTLPAPVSLKNGQKLDVLLGVNQHHGSNTPIGLTAAERERHVYVLGGTGNGKTTMLLYAIVQDIAAGKGLAVVDPHGDLAETILRHIPKDRTDDVIYLNPIDIAYPVGLNLLELPVGLSEDEELIEKDLATESIISVFRKVFSDDNTGGHRIEYVLRNTIHTAFAVEGATLFTVFRLLTDADYRKKVISTLDDEDLRNFWRNEIGKAGEFQRVKMSAGVTSKIGRFLFSASARRVLEQPHSTIRFEDVLDESKILICNFSKGSLGEDTSTLFGTVTLAKLQLAALRRSRLAQAERRPFYLYVDEFQNFATMSFLQMLSEARKYKLYLTMAEQSPSQQEQLRMVSIVLANAGTVVCFRSASPLDEDLLLPLFSPHIDKGEMLNLPTFQFYIRIAAVQSHEPLSGQTLLLADKGSEVVAQQVVAASRKTYALEYIAKPAKQKAAKALIDAENDSEDELASVSDLRDQPLNV